MLPVVGDVATVTDVAGVLAVTTDVDVDIGLVVGTCVVGFTHGGHV